MKDSLIQVWNVGRIIKQSLVERQKYNLRFGEGRIPDKYSSVIILDPIRCKKTEKTEV